MTITPATSPLRVETATIANGASLSGAVDLTGCVPVGIIMPGDWTAADLTFQGADPLDDTTYYNVYDRYGVEVTVDAAEDRHITLDPAEWVSLRRLKVRSGTSGSAVNQGAERVIKIVCRPLA